MSILKESYPGNENNIDIESQLIQDIYISKLLDGLSNEEKNIYIKKYNKLNIISKTKILEITNLGIESLDKGLYKGKLELKQARIFLFKDAIDLITEINNYNFNLKVLNKKDILIGRSICRKYCDLIRSYPLTKNAFSEEEIAEIIKNGEFPEDEKKK